MSRIRINVELKHMAVNQANDGSHVLASANRILRLPEVCAVTGFGRSMIYQMEAEGRFPRRVNIGARAVGWVEREVQQWIQQRIESARAQKTPSV
jgi:prophage regulatory protein